MDLSYENPLLSIIFSLLYSQPGWCMRYVMFVLRSLLVISASFLELLKWFGLLRTFLLDLPVTSTYVGQTALLTNGENSVIHLSQYYIITVLYAALFCSYINNFVIIIPIFCFSFLLPRCWIQLLISGVSQLSQQIQVTFKCG